MSTVMPRTFVDRSMLMTGSILAGLLKLISPRLMLYLLPKNSIWPELTVTCPSKMGRSGVPRTRRSASAWMLRVSEVSTSSVR